MSQFTQKNPAGKSSYEDAQLISAFSHQKLLKFYHSSTQKSTDFPFQFLPKKVKEPRLLTSQSHLREQKNITSPTSRISNKSMLFQQINRPFSMTNRSKNSNYGGFMMSFDNFYKKMKDRSKEKSPKTSFIPHLTNFTEVSNFETESNDHKILSAYGSNSMKSPCNDEEILHKTRKKHEFIKKNRENLRKKLIFDKFSGKISVDHDFQLFLTILCNFHDKNYDKFLLMPLIESEAFNQFLDLETLLFKLLGLFHIVFQSIAHDFETQKLEFQRIYDEFSLIRSKNSEVLKGQIDRLHEQNQKDLSKIKVNTETLEILSNFENVKLEKEFINLQKNLENRFDVKEINEEFQNFKKMSQIQTEKKNSAIKSKENILEKYYYQLNTTKGALLKNEKDLKLLQRENLELKDLNEEFKVEINDLKEKVRKYREIALMQKEDTDVNFERNSHLLKIIGLLNKKMTEIKKKISQNVQNIGFIPDSSAFQADSSFFHDVSLLMTHKFARSMSKYNLSSEDFENFKEKGSEDPSNLQRNSLLNSQMKISEFEEVLNQIILPKFQYNKPNFLTLVENSNKIFETKLESELPNIAYRISTRFLATLRGILDSKYNEFLFYHDYKSYSKFPEFVYSWLSTYEIHEETRIIQELSLEKSPDPNEIFLNFLKNLYHPLGYKLWEYQNFKEFLEEKGSIDELFFFLHCRFLLNKGPSLQKDGASFTFIHYVLYYYAEMIVDLVLKRFDEETKAFIKAHLREKAQGKNKRLFIDAAFVLKILLEYYRLERKQKFQTIKDLFKILMINNYKRNVDFETFKRIMMKIQPKVTELEKAELFRECWGLGNGEITAEIMFTVLTESNFFINTLKLRSCMNLSPARISEKLGSNAAKAVVTKEVYLKKLEFFNEKIKNYEKIEDLLKGVKRGAVELGLERVCEEFEFYWRLFSERYKFIDLSEFCGKSPDLILNRMGDLFNKVRVLRVFHGHFYEEEKGENEWEDFKRILEGFEGRMNEEKIKGFEKNNKVKKIQSFIRKKVSKWYVLMNNLLHRIKKKNI